MSAKRPEIGELIELMDARDASDAAMGGPGSGFVRFRRAGISMTVHQPGGSQTTMGVFSRALSRERIKVLTGGFVHPGSACVVLVRTIDLEERSAQGEVESCEYAMGRWHDTTVRFALPLPESAMVTPDGAASKPVRVALDGSVLVIVEHEGERARAAGDLHAAGASVVEAKCLDAGLSELRAHRFGAVASDLEISGLDPDGIVRSIRHTGHGQAIVGMASEPTSVSVTDPSVRVITKPHDEAELIEAVRVGLATTVAPAGQHLPWPHRERA